MTQQLLVIDLNDGYLNALFPGIWLEFRMFRKTLMAAALGILTATASFGFDIENISPTERDAFAASSGCHGSVERVNP